MGLHFRRRALVIALALSCACSLPARQPNAPAPEVPAEAPAARTMASVYEADLDFERRNVVESYNRIGRRNEKWDVAAVAFLEQACRCFAGGPGGPKAADVAALGTKATRVGCDDPMVLAAWGVMRSLADDPGAARPLTQGVVGLMFSEYPAYRLALAADELAENAKRTRAGSGDGAPSHQLRPGAAERAGTGDGDLSREIAIAAFVRALADPALTPHAQQYLFGKLERRIRETWDYGTALRFVRAVEAESTIPPWLSDMVRGVAYVRAAWEARGGGFANTVNERQFQRFEEQMTRARECLERAHAAAPDRPEAATWMIDVVSAGVAAEGETIDTWFDRAVAAQFDWMPAYYKTLWFLWPRWHGSYEAMLEFGLACAATDRTDTMVPLLLVHAARDVGRDSGNYAGPWRVEGVYQTARDSLKLMEADAAHAPIVDHLRTCRLIAAWRAGDYAEAARALEALGDRVDSEVLADHDANRRAIEVDVYTMSSRARELIGQAYEAAEAERWDEALKLGAEARDLVPAAEKQARLAVDDHLAVIRFTRDLLSGEWVTIEPAEGNPGWRPHAGEWAGAAADPKRRGGSPGMYGYPRGEGLLILHTVPIGMRFELEAEIDQSMLIGDEPGAGIVYGYDPGAREPRWLTFTLHQKGGKAVLGYRNEPIAEESVQQTLTGQKEMLRLRVVEDRLTAWVNDTVAFDGPTPTPVRNWQPGPYFGFSATPEATGGNLPIRKIRIRGLHKDQEAAPRGAGPP